MCRCGALGYGLAGMVVTVGLDGLFQPYCFYDSMISRGSTFHYTNECTWKKSLIAFQAHKAEYN